MNKKIYVIGLVALGLYASSCDDKLSVKKYFKDRFTIEEVFEKEDYTEKWLANAYSYLSPYLADVCSKGYIPFCFADDMYYGDRDDQYKRWKSGEYNEGWWQEAWGNAYKGIRQASIMIQYIDLNKDFSPTKRADYKAQARFVRAYYYWKLMQRYGPVPLMPDEGVDYNESYDDIATPRSTYDECANYVASELQLAARDLPLSRSANAIARPTKGAALAARAKVLLFAASPLYNPRPSDTERFTDLVDNEGRPLLSQEYDEEKWARAAAAARDVMELNRYELYHAPVRHGDNPAYPATITPPADNDFSLRNWPDGWRDIDPFESYRSVFNGALNPSVNPELIFTRGQNQSSEGINVMVIHQLPRTATGWNTHGMTQKQCDAYYMNDGTDAPGKDKEIGRGDGSERVKGFVTEEDAPKYPELGVLKYRKDVSLQYVQREPRFYASVAYSGAVWHLLNEPLNEDKEKQVFYYRGEGNGYTNTMFWLRTGIGIMKFVHPDDTYRDTQVGRTRVKAEPAIRYAEMLLIYAEALNELDGTYQISSWNGAKTYTISRDIKEMKKGIRPVRCRAGIPDYSDAVYADKDVFRAKLKRERQIELMGEGHRYFDLRRWRDAPVEEALTVYGCNTLMTKDQAELFYTPVPIPSLPTVFSRRAWFWPIPLDELKKNRELTQNPGWRYND